MTKTDVNICRSFDCRNKYKKNNISCLGVERNTEMINIDCVSAEIFDDKRDHDAFSIEYDKLFVKGRAFLSDKQLYQSGCKFQEA